MRSYFKWRRCWPAWLPGLAAMAQIGGCLPDNAVRTVGAEQLVQTYGLGVQGFTSLIFGFPDLILNSIALSVLSSLLAGS